MTPPDVRSLRATLDDELEQLARTHSNTAADLLRQRAQIAIDHTSGYIRALTGILPQQCFALLVQAHHAAAVPDIPQLLGQLQRALDIAHHALRTKAVARPSEAKPLKQTADCLLEKLRRKKCPPG